MPKPSVPPGQAKKKDEKATKTVASFAKGKSVSVSVTVPADELAQYGAAELEALAVNINALSEALSAVPEDEEDEEGNVLPVV